MVNNYKILRKAQLAEELFVGDSDEAATAQEEADRDWAHSVDPTQQGGVGAVQPAALTEAEERFELPEPSGLDYTRTGIEYTRAVAPVRTERSWAEVLTDLTGNPALEGIRTLGVCALERKKSTSAATAALAHWMVQYTNQPVLVVEAHFRRPRLARVFDARGSGVSDVLLRNEPLERMIQDSADAGLKLLTGGDVIGSLERRKVLEHFPALFASLRERFRSVIVELPAVDDPVFDKLPIGLLADAVILVADSKSAQPRKLSQTAGKLREARTVLAASMLDSTQMLSAQLRRNRLAQKVQPSEPMRGLTRLGI
jgi:Mrp family chromosome partitioning ATPase